MSTAETLTIFITVVVAFLGAVLAIVWYIGGQLNRLEDSLGRRIDKLDEHVQELREDVAVLKATR